MLNATTPRDFRNAAAAGASVVRLVASWASVSPDKPPSRTQARDPQWDGYHWGGLDRLVKQAHAEGLDPLVTVGDPPKWAAQLPPRRPHGPWNVDVRGFSDFGRAVATRYSGRLEGLPSVRKWMVWNEPNLARYLNPQFGAGTPRSPGIYRSLLNAFADEVHAVRTDNVVIAGGTAPFTAWKAKTKAQWGMGPLTFMRTLLCLSPKLKPTCSARAKFDVWAHHPYTSGGPTHTAYRAADVSLGDLPEMRAVLDAAIKYRRIASLHRPLFWVTEFSWDTSPPDPKGVPLSLHARWVSEALYQMWRSKVSLVLWYGIRDEPFPRSPYQSGLFFGGDAGKAKPALQAFRFPFVAYREGGALVTWGRTPAGKTGTVVVEQRVGGAWRRVGTVATNRNGVFARTFAAKATGPVRARMGTADGSRPFSLQRPPDRAVLPFGSV